MKNYASLKVQILFTGFLILISLLLLAIYLCNDITWSNDQIAYLSSAESVITNNFSLKFWNPSATFSYFLGIFISLFHDPKLAFLVIFTLTTFFYLYSMSVSLKKFIECEWLSNFIAVISLTPMYTLGMTYWGFNSFNMIMGRILIMPFAPIVITWAYKEKDSRRIWMPLLLCSLSGLLHLEILYLTAILILTLSTYALRRTEAIKYFLNFTITILPCVLVVMMIVLSLHYIANGYMMVDTSYWERVVNLIHKDYVINLSNQSYLNLQWKSASVAFWWTMFPPRIIDVLYILFNSTFLFVLGFLGLWEIKNRCYELHQFIIRFTLSALTVAYGYQFFCYIGRFLWGASPSIWEEVRAVKFIYFFIYLSIGFLFKKWLVEKKFGLIVIASILIVFSPMQMLTMLPTQWKERLVMQTSTIFKQPHLAEYFRKALKIVDVKQERDLKVIEGIFAKEVKTDHLTYVLTDIHSLKQSGVVTLISYQDKRIGRSQTNRESALPYWYLAYQEINQVLRSGNAQKVVQTAKKYQCEWIVSYQKLSDEKLIPRYEGEELFLYQVNE